MAVRFNGSAASGFSSTSGLPTSALFTVTFWVYFVSAPAAGGGIIWSIDSSTSQYVYFGTAGSPAFLVVDWPGAGVITGPVISLGTWYKVSVTINGTGAYMDVALPGSLLTTYTTGTSFIFPTGTLKFWVGDSVFGSNYVHCRIANLKMWLADLGLDDLEQELQSYVPQRTANLNRWHPFIKSEVTDYSGNARTFSGGASATTEPGPPISWSRPRVALIPWDPATIVWYAVFDSSTGELISIGTAADLPLPAGLSYKTYLGVRPNEGQAVWDTTAREFVLIAGFDLVDRVADLLGESGMAAVWADLTGGNSAILQSRIATLLGPYRYREPGQSVDL